MAGEPYRYIVEGSLLLRIALRSQDLHAPLQIKDIKHWLLTKCNAWPSVSVPTPRHTTFANKASSAFSSWQPPRFRPASPVTFASRRSSSDSISPSSSGNGLGFHSTGSLYVGSTDDFSIGGTEGRSEEGSLGTDGEDDDGEVFAYSVDRDSRPFNGVVRERSPLSRTTTHLAEHSGFSSSAVLPQSSTTPPPPPASTGHPPTQSFTLLSFSSGFVLEDEASLEWYNLRPFELLELHRTAGIVPLLKGRRPPGAGAAAVVGAGGRQPMMMALVWA